MEVIYILDVIRDCADQVTFHYLHMINIIEQSYSRRIDALADFHSPCSMVALVIRVIHLAVKQFEAEINTFFLRGFRNAAQPFCHDLYPLVIWKTLTVAGETDKPGDVIFSEYEPGDNFYLIQTGQVQIVKIFGDLEKTIAVLNPGEIFGEMAILEEAPRSATAIAIDQVTALEFNQENFDILMQGNPQVALTLLKLFAMRIHDQKRKFQILTRDDVEAKVADVFLMLSEHEPVDTTEVEKMEFKTTVDDIAHWAGISPEKCRQVINHFINQRRVELFPDHIVVRNINDFARFVKSRRRHQE